MYLLRKGELVSKVSAQKKEENVMTATNMCSNFCGFRCSPPPPPPWSSILFQVGNRPQMGRFPLYSFRKILKAIFFVFGHLAQHTAMRGNMKFPVQLHSDGSLRLPISLLPFIFDSANVFIIDDYSASFSRRP